MRRYVSESASYTGEVTVGGPVDVRVLRDLTIAKISVGPASNNVYLLRDHSTGEGLLIDAANEADRVLELTRLADERDAAISTILTTHRHADHWQALAEVVAATGADTLAGTLDAPELPVAVTQTVDHGDTVTVGSTTLDVIGLRGHTPGSVALLYTDPVGHGHLFTGDSLFPGGVGRTWSPEDFTSLLNDVISRVFDRLPDDTWVYPGHGNDTTLGAERAQLGEWRERGW
jgi:glyoxylase-like metal-dependent hydrolase (beta-lactamase superfamily II)